MPSNASDLTSLIGSRICHDLISPLGAISNGVELLSMNGAPIGPEMSLISESVENANARIRFFRIAFGAASAAQAVGQSEIKSTLHDMSRGGRLVIDWQPQGDQNRRQVKLAFLLLQCFETAMPWGGHVSISAVGEQWAIYGQADKMRIDPDIWQVLSGGSSKDDINAAQVHFALAPVAAHEIGRTLTIEHSDNSARIRF